VPVISCRNCLNTTTSVVPEQRISQGLAAMRPDRLTGFRRALGRLAASREQGSEHPLAAGVLYPSQGLLLSPMIAASVAGPVLK
jgi:hypothetical protein